MAKYTIYRIFYDDLIVYVGRTKQPLQDRIRGHLFRAPMMRSLHIDQISKIEYAELKSEADMNLYEIYYILRWKPPLNVDDKTNDLLTVSLPELEWKVFTTPLLDKWREKLAEEDNAVEKAKQAEREYIEAKRILRSAIRIGGISEEEGFAKLAELEKTHQESRKTLYGR